MNLSMAYLKNENQVQYMQIDNNDEIVHQIFNFEELADKSIHGLFIPKELLQNDDLFEKVQKQTPYSPIRPVQDDFLSSSDFEKLNANQARTLLEKTFSTWTLQNNLSLLENLFSMLNHMKNLWPNDRTTFFEEMWNLIKINLGSTRLSLAYNHLEKAEKEGSKNKLIRIVIEGDKFPNPAENKELGESLFSNYEGMFTENFEVASYDKEKGEIVILGSINSSPIIIMAQVFEFTSFQRALLKSLFDGLQA